MADLSSALACRRWSITVIDGLSQRKFHLIATFRLHCKSFLAPKNEKRSEFLEENFHASAHTHPHRPEPELTFCWFSSRRRKTLSQRCVWASGKSPEFLLIATEKRRRWCCCFPARALVACVCCCFPEHKQDWIWKIGRNHQRHITIMRNVAICRFQFCLFRSLVLLLSRRWKGRNENIFHHLWALHGDKHTMDGWMSWGWVAVAGGWLNPYNYKQHWKCFRNRARRRSWFPKQQWCHGGGGMGRWREWNKNVFRGRQMRL